MSKESVYILVPVKIEVMTDDNSGEELVTSVTFPSNSEVNEEYLKNRCGFETKVDIQGALNRYIHNISKEFE